ncbi:MAG: YraN family protein [Muribaculaceae bacterium]|nr:YraN family protein [Muribaculaceae bacterium]
MARHNALGDWGEKVAASLLASQGYAILENNWRMGNYEVDLIAMNDSHVVFVEVKTRSNPDYDPAAAVDARRIRRLARAAHLFLTQNNYPHEYRFDIIAVTGNEDNYTVEHIIDAFLPPLTASR